MTTETVEGLKIGDYVIAKRIPLITGGDMDEVDGVTATGQKVQVTHIYKNDDGFITGLFAMFDRGAFKPVLGFNFDQWDHADSPEEIDPYLDWSREKLKESLIASVESFNAIEAKFHKEQTLYEDLLRDGRRAMSYISEVLLSEASDRGWCDEFDAITKDVNEKLPLGFELETRSKEYLVTWSEEYLVQVQRSAVITANSADDATSEAQEEFDEQADSFELVDAINCGNYNHYNSEDYEAEEQ